MRAVTFLSLTFAMAVSAGACRAPADDADQIASRAPTRDLTLHETQPAPIEVASPVELARAPVQRRVTHQVRRTRQAAPVPRRQAMAAMTGPAVPVPAAAVAAPTSLATTESKPLDPHALAPGQTVTVLTSSGGSANEAPSSGGGDWTDQIPGDRGRGTTIRGGRGGDCGPRGHGGRSGGGGFRGLR